MLSKISNNIRLRDTLLLSYTKSGSRHLYLEYFRMYNLVQGDVKRQNKCIYIYIYLTKLKKNNGSLKIMGTTQNFFLYYVCFDIK